MINYKTPINDIGWYDITLEKRGDKIYTKMEEKIGDDWFLVTYVYDEEIKSNVLVSRIPIEKNS